MSLVDLNLRLAGLGGARHRRKHQPEGLGAGERVQEQGTGAAAWMRKLIVDCEADPLRPVKLAGRIGNP